MKLIKKTTALKEEASVIFKEQDFAAAIKKFEECIALDPLNHQFNSTVLLNMSIAYEKLGNKKEKLVCLNEAIKNNPKYSKALVRRGDYFLSEEEYNEAIRDYSEAAEHDHNGFNVQQKIKTAQQKAKAAKRKDYYKILGVPKEAQDAVIRKAYKKLSLKWHPDKNSNGTEEEKRKADKMFKDVNEAKNILTDRDKRDKYD